MINKDMMLDCVNAIKKTQKDIAAFASLSREFVFSNVQLEMAIRCLYSGMSEIKDIPYDSGDAPVAEPVPKA